MGQSSCAGFSVNALSNRCSLTFGRVPGNQPLARPQGD